MPKAHSSKPFARKKLENLNTPRSAQILNPNNIVMRILIVASLNNKSHFAPFIMEQAEALTRIGVAVDYYGVEGKGLKGYLGNLKSLKKAIDEFRPDVIHAHYGMCGLLANLQRQVPVVTTYHGSDINNPKAFRWSRLSMALSKFNIVVSRSHYDNVCKRKKWLKRKSKLMPCGINLDDYPIEDKATARSLMELPSNRKLVLFTGAFDNKVKNYPLAREAVNLLNYKHPQYNAKLIELKGYTRREVAMLLNACDCLLMTSLSEGSPQIVKEAMACGCPVVSVNVGDVAHSIMETHGSALVNSRSPKELSFALARVISADKRTDGREYIVRHRLTNDTIAKRLNKIYHRMGKRRKANSLRHL